MRTKRQLSRVATKSPPHNAIDFYRVVVYKVVIAMSAITTSPTHALAGSSFPGATMRCIGDD